MNNLFQQQREELVALIRLINSQWEPEVSGWPDAELNGYIAEMLVTHRHDMERAIKCFASMVIHVKTVVSLKEVGERGRII